MNTKFVDLTVQTDTIKKEVFSKWNEIVDNHRFISGEEVRAFENNFASRCSAKYSVGLSSGTDANILSVLCKDFSPESEVIVPVNTYIATAAGVSHSNMKPIFIDVEEESYNLNPNKIEELITDRTKAIIPVHLYGNPAKMNEIITVARKYNIFVIEDSSQAHFAEISGKKVGGFGDISTWSFYPGKNLGAWGEAGAVVTNNFEIYELIKKYRNHGGLKKYQHELIGFNFRMSELQAVVLNEKMKYIDEWTNERIEIAKKYQARLNHVEEIICPSKSVRDKHVFHLFVVRTKKRDLLKKHLSENGIETSIHYPNCLHQNKAYQNLGYKNGDFPIAEKISNEILSLPLYIGMSDDQIDYVCDKIKIFFKKQ